jgi:hypothetical protein
MLFWMPKHSKLLVNFPLDCAMAWKVKRPCHPHIPPIPPFQTPTYVLHLVALTVHCGEIWRRINQSGWTNPAQKSYELRVYHVSSQGYCRYCMGLSFECCMLLLHDLQTVSKPEFYGVAPCSWFRLTVDPAQHLEGLVKWDLASVFVNVSGCNHWAQSSPLGERLCDRTVL